MALSVGVWTLASLLHGTARNPFEMGLYRFLLGVGEGGCFPGAARGVLEWFPKHERALAMGIATSGGSAIGAVIAPPAIVWAFNRVGWRGAFVLTGAIGAAWLLAWLIGYRAPRDVPEIDRGALAAVSWRSLLSTRNVRALVVSRFLFDPVFYFYMFWIPQYLSQMRGASVDRIGRLTWIPFLMLGISSVFGGWISDRLVRAGLAAEKARKSILIGAALLTPVSSFCVFVHSVEAAIALMSVLTFAHGFWITNYMTIIGDLYHRGSTATVVGLTGTAGGIGGFLASLGIGRVVQAVSYTPVFLLSGLIYPICAVIITMTVVFPSEVPSAGEPSPS
jgi:ACS family hexuronate transporter-like MFS transporter